MPIPQAKAAAKAKAKAQVAPPEVSMPAANAGAQPNPHVPDFVVGQMPSQISEMVSDSVRRSPFGLYADVSISHMEESGLSSGTVQQQEAVQEAQKDIAVGFRAAVPQVVRCERFYARDDLEQWADQEKTKLSTGTGGIDCYAAVSIFLCLQIIPSAVVLRLHSFFTNIISPAPSTRATSGDTGGVSRTQLSVLILELIGDGATSLPAPPSGTESPVQWQWATFLSVQLQPAVRSALKVRAMIAAAVHPFSEQIESMKYEIQELKAGKRARPTDQPAETAREGEQVCLHWLASAPGTEQRAHCSQCHGRLAHQCSVSKAKRLHRKHTAIFRGRLLSELLAKCHQ
jgi:hypothetical protein